MLSGLIAKLFPTVETSLLDEEERAIAQSGNEKDRLALAKSEKASQEILQYMAEEDNSARVRGAVAKNPSTPLSAAPVLSKDSSQDVRLQLAQRLVTILPDLPNDKHSQLYAFAVQALGDLALDEVIKIRRALTETLKDLAHTPPSVAFQLAKDLERTVSEPILRFCTALSDEALIEVLETHPANWAAEAVAQRDKVSAPVSKAVIDTGNRKAGQFLLENKGANISSSLLEEIVERAREYPEWHKPIAARAELPPLMASKLAAFAESSARKILMERSDLDQAAINEVLNVMQRRLDYGTEKKKVEKKKNLEPETKESAQVRAQKIHGKGDLTENLLGDALAMQDKEFVLESIALLTGYTRASINRIFDARAPKSICALCWKAGLSMRFALQLQQTLGRVPTASLIYPKGGTDYPFPAEEMAWQLELLGMR